MTPSDTSDSQSDEEPELEIIGDDDVDLDLGSEEEVVAPKEYIIIIRDALNTAYYKSLSEDHIQAYRSLNTGPFKSRHTNQLAEALQKAEALVQLAESNAENSG